MRPCEPSRREVLTVFLCRWRWQAGLSHHSLGTAGDAQHTTALRMLTDAVALEAARPPAEADNATLYQVRRHCLSDLDPNIQSLSVIRRLPVLAYS